VSKHRHAPSPHMHRHRGSRNRCALIARHPPPTRGWVRFRRTPEPSAADPETTTCRPRKHRVDGTQAAGGPPSDPPSLRAPPTPPTPRSTTRRPCVHGGSRHDTAAHVRVGRTRPGLAMHPWQHRRPCVHGANSVEGGARSHNHPPPLRARGGRFAVVGHPPPPRARGEHPLAMGGPPCDAAAPACTGRTFRSDRRCSVLTPAVPACTGRTIRWPAESVALPCRPVRAGQTVLAGPTCAGPPRRPHAHGGGASNATRSQETCPPPTRAADTASAVLPKPQAPPPLRARGERSDDLAQRRGVSAPATPACTGRTPWLRS
jgi:hypothetical protein